MNAINLLPWRETLRRMRRWQRVIGWGLVLCLLLGVEMGVRCYAVRGSGRLQQKMTVLRASFDSAKGQRAAVEGALGELEHRWQVLQQQQIWRDDYACQRRWLGELGLKLPLGAQVEKVSVTAGQVHIVVSMSQDLVLKDLTQAVASLSELLQVSVRQLNSEDEQHLMRVELQALLKCG